MLDSRRLRKFLAVFFAFSLVAAACGGGDGDDGAAEADPSDEEPGTSETTDPPEGSGVDETADGSDAVTAEDETVEIIEGGTLRMSLQTEATS